MYAEPVAAIRCKGFSNTVRTQASYQPEPPSPPKEKRGDRPSCITPWKERTDVPSGPFRSQADCNKSHQVPSEPLRSQGDCDESQPKRSFAMIREDATRRENEKWQSMIYIAVIQ